LSGGAGALAPAAQRVERSGQRHVVDVVAGGLRVPPVLAPAGNPGVDQAGVAPQARVGPEAEPFGGAGPEPLDEHVGPVDEPERGREACGMLEVDRDGTSAARHQVDAAVAADHALHAGFVFGGGDVIQPGDPHHVGPEVGQDHGAERARSAPLQLDAPQPGQRSGQGGAPAGRLRHTPPRSRHRR
jgi:hypothetical protein